ncbi:MAG: hypothetical protein ACREA0_10550 [bacterium]
MYRPRRGDLLGVVALLLAGCAPTLHGGGHVEIWKADLQACNLETLAFGFIPDFGATKDFHLRKCMKERSWVDLTGWAWTGPGATMQLHHFPNGDQQMVLVCPARKTCETVRPSPTPTDLVSWAFQAWPSEVSRQTDVVIVGDQASCEVVRQREASRGIPVAPNCEGPRFFERTIQEATK